MRCNHLLACLLSITILVALQACQDHRLGLVSPGSSTVRLRVKSLTEQLSGSSAKVTAFTYDAQGRLSALLAYQSPDSSTAAIERSTFQYDVQNRLIRQQRQVITRPGALFGPIAEGHQFSYNSSGQVAEVRYLTSFYLFNSPGQTVVDLGVLNDPKALTDIATLRYNTANQLIGARRVNYFQGQPNPYDLVFTSEYSYSGDDLTFVKNVTTQSGAAAGNEQNTLSYDAKINPFYGVYVIPKYFGGISNTFQNLNTLSPHNITNIGGVSYRYEYNASNLPTVRYTVTDKVVETLRFEYESY